MDDDQIAEFMGEIREAVKNIDKNITAINGRLQEGDRAFSDLRGHVQGVRQTVYGENGDKGLVDIVKKQGEDLDSTTKTITRAGAILSAVILGVTLFKDDVLAALGYR